MVIGSAPVGSLAAEFGQTSDAAVEEAVVEEAVAAETEEEVAAGATSVPAEEDQEVTGATVAPAEDAAQYYTVTLDANGGSFVNERDDILGETVENTEVLNKNILFNGTIETIETIGTIETVPVKESATFMGWSLVRNGEVLEADYVPAENCTLYAVWQMEEVVAKETGEDVSSEDVIEEDVPAADEMPAEADVQDAEYVYDSEQSDTEQSAEIGENPEAVPAQDSRAADDRDSLDAEEAENADPGETITAAEAENTTTEKQDAEPEQDESVTVDTERKSVSEDADIGVATNGTCGDNATRMPDENPQEADPAEEQFAYETVGEENISENPGLGNVVLTWPVPGHTMPDSISQWLHGGCAIDISDGSIAGADIVAALGGTVAYRFGCVTQHPGMLSYNGCNCDGFGTGIVINGDDGRIYQYAHMQAGSIPANVVVGARVNQGQLIGKVGNTGAAKGIHLHFGISYGTYYSQNGVDPSQETYGDISQYLPTNVSVSMNKSVLQLNESVTFFCASDRGVGYTIGIDDAAGNRIDTYDMGTSTSQYTRSFNSPGCYSCYVTAYNDYGYTDSARIFSSVYGTQTIPDGNYHIVSALDNSKGLDVNGNNSADGTNVDLFANTEDRDQVFTVRYLDDGTYAIIHRSSGKCLDVYQAALENGANVDIWTSNNSSSQKWVINGTGDGQYFNVISMCNGRYLDVAGGSASDHTNIQVYENNGSNAQKWKFIKNTDWKLDSEGTLTISGTGEMENYSFTENAPWAYAKDKIRAVVIKEGITKIGDFAFNCCENLTSVTIPDGVTNIGMSAFRCCSSLESISIPDGVLGIGYAAFDGCSSLTEITIPDSVTAIGKAVFNDCSSLESISIPDSVTVFGAGLFSGCSSLKSITIPPTQTRIYNTTFCNCSSLASITIPPGVTSIEFSAFAGCSSLTSITIPSGVTNINCDAFNGCTSLESIVVSPENAVYHDGNGCNAIISSGTGALIVGCKDTVIPEGVTSIGAWAFCGCTSLTGVTIPNSVTSIEFDAFKGCTSLTSVTIPNSVTSIGEFAFSGCTSLAGVTIPNSLTNIGSAAFSGCSNLTGVTIPDSVTSIERCAFYDCSSLTRVEIPNSVTSIGEEAFGNCSDQLVIYGMPGSYTEQYANENNIPFIDNSAIPISRASVTISAQTYNGRAQTPAPVVKVDSTTLNANTDYTVSYKNNTYAGTATVTITGRGNYTGTKTASFKINKADQSITAKSSASSVAVGKTATISISGAKGTKSYKSSDTAIAAVDKSTGKLTAKKVGTVKITAASAATSNFNAASRTVTVKVVPAATSSLTAANQAKGIKLTWKKVTGATGYLVYRGSTKIATIKSGSTVTYTDTKANTNGTKYTYKIIPTASTGNGPAKSVTAYCVARPAISSVSNSASGKITVKWGKNAKATGYQIHYCMDKTFKTDNKSVSIKSADTVSKAIASLTKDKTYYVRLRTYKTVGSTKYFSAWSPVKSVKISK